MLLLLFISESSAEEWVIFGSTGCYVGVDKGNIKGKLKLCVDGVYACCETGFGEHVTQCK